MQRNKKIIINRAEINKISEGVTILDNSSWNIVQNYAKFLSIFTVPKVQMIFRYVWAKWGQPKHADIIRKWIHKLLVLLEQNVRLSLNYFLLGRCKLIFLVVLFFFFYICTACLGKQNGKINNKWHLDKENVHWNTW